MHEIWDGHALGFGFWGVLSQGCSPARHNQARTKHRWSDEDEARRAPQITSYDFQHAIPSGTRKPKTARIL
jgi:hypothetical protein